MLQTFHKCKVCNAADFETIFYVGPNIFLLSLEYHYGGPFMLMCFNDAVPHLEEEKNEAFQHDGAMPLLATSSELLYRQMQP
jgi:hypothetical protein